MALVSILPAGFDPGSRMIKNPQEYMKKQNMTPSKSIGDFGSLESYPAMLVPFDMEGLSGPLAPIVETGGLVFQYTPGISESVSINYSTSGDIVHSNEQYNVYKNTSNRDISLDSVVFTADTEENARYMLAAIHFFRVYSLMDFGKGKTGKPPSPMWFSAYGGLAFDRIPVLLSGATITWPKDIDYVRVGSTGSSSGKPQSEASASPNQDRTKGSPDRPFFEKPINGYNATAGQAITKTANTSIPSFNNAISRANPNNEPEQSDISESSFAWVPAKIEISGIKLTVQHTPAYWKNNFSLEDFYSGGMVENRETSMPNDNQEPADTSAGSGTKSQGARSTVQSLPSSVASYSQFNANRTPRT